MTFLQPLLLWALPLAALPVIIHLIHLYRRRQVKWAAMIFLRAAQRMNKGLSRLRQILILALRVLAVAALLFVITRPLAGGWLGLTGGAPDTVLILLDRSASMEQQNLATGVSKRAAGLRNLAKAIDDAVGTRSRLVLIDSATRQPEPIEKASALIDHPATTATETGADIPALLQSALDYVTTNQTGRTDVWILSDLQASDWDEGGGRWEPLRSAFATLKGVRFHVLAYPQPVADDLGVTVENVVRRESSEKAELQFDLRVTRRSENRATVELPLRLVINGATTTLKVSLGESGAVLQGQVVPIDKATRRGWGRVELPADANPANDVFHFVFDVPPPLQSIIVTDDDAEAGPLVAALSAPSDPARKFTATVVPPARVAEIPWESTALLVWHAPIPAPESVLAGQLTSHVARGRAVFFLPPENPDANAIFGLRWDGWAGDAAARAQSVDWWRNDADVLANARDGTALPVGALEVQRHCAIGGEGIPLARLADRTTLLMRSAQTQTGAAYFLGTLPGGTSSLARDGVVLFAALHRALQESGRTLGLARQQVAAADAFGADAAAWKSVASAAGESITSLTLPLRAGIVSNGDRITALNRPPREDEPRALEDPAVAGLFSGLEFRLLTGSLETGRSLTNEIWRTFLIAMALALVAEALLCLPPRREDRGPQSIRAGFPSAKSSEPAPLP